MSEPELLQEENAPVEKAPKKHPGRGWRIFLLLWSLLLLGSGALGCSVLYRYLAAFEAARPDPVIDRLMAETTAETWMDYALVGLEGSINEYDDPEALKTAYRESFLEGKTPVCIKDMTATTDTTLAYTIRMNTATCCTVLLTQDTATELGFGLSPWVVSEIIPYNGIDALSVTAVEITVPAGETVYLNGRELDDSAIVDSDVALENVSRFETELTGLPRLVCYRVEGLMGSITVTDGSGDILDPVSHEDGLVSYFEDITPANSVTVTAPNNVSVTINGIPLREETIVNVSDSLLKGLEAYTDGNDYYTVTYRVDGLFCEPQVLACTADGVALEPEIDENGTLRYSLPEDTRLREEKLSRVQGFFRRYMKCTTSAFDIDNYHELLYFILPDSDLFTYVKDSNITMLWNSDTKLDYSHLDYYGFRSVSDRCFMCRVSYAATVSATGWDESFTYEAENTYDLVWVLSSGVWFCAVMSAATD